MAVLADAELRPAAADALGKLPAAADLEPLVVALSHEDSDVRGIAADVLARLGWIPKSDEESALNAVARKNWDEALSLGPAAVEPLISAATTGRDFDVRESAVEILGKLGDARAVKPLIEILTEMRGDIRREAAVALGRLGDARAVEPLIAALEAATLETDDEARTVTAYALGKFLAAEKVQQLAGEAQISALRKTLKAPGLRLSQYESAEPVTLRRWRLQAATALGELGGSRATAALLETLDDEDSQVRVAVVRALSQQRDPSLTASLAKAFSDDDSAVSEAAADALTAIGQPAVSTGAES